MVPPDLHFFAPTKTCEFAPHRFAKNYAIFHTDLKHTVPFLDIAPLGTGGCAGLRGGPPPPRPRPPPRFGFPPRRF